MPQATREPTQLDTSEESATGALYRAAIGPVNTAYYLPRFMRYESDKRTGPGWNWAASLNTLNWMIFRRLWGPALFYLMLVGVTLLLLAALGHLLWSDATTRGLLLTVLVWSCVIPGLYGNAWLHAHSRKRMARALAASNTLSEACDQLHKEASSRRRLFWLALANLALAGTALLLGLALPAPQRPAAAPAPNAPAQPDDRVSAGLLQTGSIQRLAEAVPAPAASAPLPTADPVPASTAAAPGASAFHINVGLFADPANARKAYQRLRDAGLAAHTQELKTRQGQRTRVRVGPFDTQAQAETAARQIQALQLEAVVLPTAADAPAR